MPSQTDSIFTDFKLTIRLYYIDSSKAEAETCLTRAANNYCDGRVLFRKRAMIGSVIGVTADS